MNDTHLIVVLTVFTAGCVVGRWLYRCVLRFPEHYPLKDQLFSLCHEGDCRSCRSKEAGLQHLPLISWLLDGRCRKCRRKMDPRRPLMELLTGLLLAWLYWVEIPDYTDLVVQNSGLWTRERPPGPEIVNSLWSPLFWLHLRYLVHAVMLCGLMVATVIDFEQCIIPDGCTVPAMIFAVLLSFAAGQTWIVPLWFQDTSTANAIRRFLPEVLQGIIFEWDAVKFAIAHPHWHGLLVSLAGLLAGAGIVWLVRAIGFWTLKQEAMGDGDVVLMALIGSVVGWQPVLVVFMMAIILGVIPGLTMSWLRRDSQGPVHFPFGPWLSLAALLLLLAWQTIWPNAKAMFDFGLVLILFGLTGFLGMAVMLRVVYLVKFRLGIAGPQLEAENDWSSADHLNYYGAERPDEQTGLWAIPQWPGGRSGRGLKHNHDWRNPNQ